MTLDDIVDDFDSKFGGLECTQRPSKCNCRPEEHEFRSSIPEIKEYLIDSCIQFVKSIVPEEKEGTPIKKPKLGRPPKYKKAEMNIVRPFADGFNACRTQILDNITKAE